MSKVHFKACPHIKRLTQILSTCQKSSRKLVNYSKSEPTFYKHAKYLPDTLSTHQISNSKLVNISKG